MQIEPAVDSRIVKRRLLWVVFFDCYIPPGRMVEQTGQFRETLPGGKIVGVWPLSNLQGLKNIGTESPGKLSLVFYFPPFPQKSQSESWGSLGGMPEIPQSIRQPHSFSAVVGKSIWGKKKKPKHLETGNAKFLKGLTVDPRGIPWLRMCFA